ncbi:MAG: methyl-accepting chemotaxis protein [Methyloligellaceae bacterium]
MFSFGKSRHSEPTSGAAGGAEERAAGEMSHAGGGMASRLSSIKIGKRIYGGFAFVLAALIFLAVETVIEVEKLREEFEAYGNMAHDAQLVSNLGGALTAMQLNAREYMIKTTDAELNEYKLAEEKVDKLIAKAKDEIHKPERANLVKDIDEKMHEYKTGFAKIVELVRERNDIVYKTLNPVGLSVRQKLTQIREGAFSAGDHESASFAGIAQEHLLLARLYVLKFLDTNDDKSVERVNEEFGKLDKALSHLDKSLENPGRRKLLKEVSDTLPAYRSGFERLVAAIKERNRIRKDLLDHDAAVMLEDAEKIKQSAAADERSLFDQVQAEVRSAEVMDVIIAAIALLIGSIVAYLIGRSITRPILGLSASMEKLAEGDNTVDVPGTERGDEVGQMAKTVLVFKENAIERARLMSESEKEQEARARRTARMDELIKNFDEVIRAVMSSVVSASETINTTAQEMSATAEQTNSQAAAVAAAAEEASSSSATVAGSTEELTATINEISAEVTKSSEIAQQAASQAEVTNAQVAELSEAANRIGTVVELISEIAEQTNLLALNATIEAARAGEAGKGFAVVASEVKELASQTGKATAEIGEQIEAIQTVTNQAVTAIKEISETINQINSMSASVASAMTEQQAATQEIARAVQQAAQGTNEVSTNIHGVSNAAGTTTAAANRLSEAAEQLSDQSGKLRTEVETFLNEVRAA